MENLIKVNRPIFSAMREFKLAPDVMLKIHLVSEPMVHFLIESLEDDPYCIVGDIGALRRRKKEIDEILEAQQLKEYLQANCKSKSNMKPKYELGLFPILKSE